MAAVDEKYRLNALKPPVNVAQMAAARREVEATARAEKLQVCSALPLCHGNTQPSPYSGLRTHTQARKERLCRRINRAKRVANLGGTALEEGGEDDAEGGDSGSELSGEEGNDDPGRLAAELLLVERELVTLRGGTVATDAEQGPAAPAGAEQNVDLTAESSPEVPVQAITKFARRSRSRVWCAFDRCTQRCKLPHPDDANKICNSLPEAGSGTSGFIRHLEKVYQFYP